MAAGDIAASFGFTPVLSTDERRLGYSRINDAADFAAKLGRLEFTNATALIAYTANARQRQRAIDLATGDEYRFKGTAWQLWETEWKTFTPAWTGVTVGNGTNTGLYRFRGGQVEFSASVNLGSTSAVTGSVFVDLPVACESMSGSYYYLVGNAWAYDGISRIYECHPLQSGGTQYRFRALKVNGTTVDYQDITNNYPPASWAVGTNFNVRATYRVYA